ncbi:TetR/AcrR family transcriptional regulator [Salinispora oceanensis]|uniref:TetR/AcrR family transcriptional regulator n=1 Tax=Salinispora oceanensis TaxID=1050199 RepID=UPI001CC5EC6D|nr:TetR/AcrR family transcriptional regulator [Salinispora oceanensis]
MTETDRPRRRGRHAEKARNDRRVLEAAREVFTTQGSDAPIAAVAERAGLGIGSLYRRYGSKEELLQQLCLLAMRQTADAAQAGLDIEDPWAGLVQYVQRCVAQRSGALAPVAGSIPVTVEMEQVSEQVWELAEKLVARAKRAGALRDDVTTLDISLLIEMVSRRPPSGPAEEDDLTRRRLLAISLAGLRAPAVEPLPGPAPSIDAYHERWEQGGGGTP